jgi:4,5-dihydroxyphthalate decarboxylase
MSGGATTAARPGGPGPHAAPGGPAAHAAPGGSAAAAHAEAGALTLALGAAPRFAALRAAGALPDGTALAFPDVSPIHRAFAPMAREGRFDLSEMAIVTAIQALAFGRPLLLLPVTLAARFQHRCLIRLASRPEVTPATLCGARIAVRAYTQTTGFWVRDILAEEHGIAPGDVTWITQEGAHVAEYADPPNVSRGADVPLIELLRRGGAEAAILGNDLPDGPEFAPVIAEPGAASRAWAARHGIAMVNHVLVARQDVAAARPGALRAAIRALADPLLPAGEAALRPVLEHILPAMQRQALLPRDITADEVLAPARALLAD